MSSKKCPRCGLTNFAEAETCKRCGEKLPTARQAAYREQMSSAATPPPAKRPPVSSSAITALVVIVAVIGVCGLLRLSPRSPSSSVTTQSTPVSPAADEAVSKRRQFARGLGSMIGGGILRNVDVSTEDIDDKTLVITADNMTQDDCGIIAASTYMGAAELAGFDLLVCRERGGDEWKRRLFPK
jgi:hypothetical protein